MTFHVTSMIYKLGTVSHEIGHALGFNHEQSRPDRDEYVTVNFDNIQTSFRNNFDKRTTTDAMTNVPYDYSSAMHYGPYVSGGTSLDFPDSFCFEAHCTTRFIVVIQGHRGGTYQLCRLIWSGWSLARSPFHSLCVNTLTNELFLKQPLYFNAVNTTLSGIILTCKRIM